MDDKYIGLLLAMSSSLAIGVSFILTKIGHQQVSAISSNSDEYAYLKMPIWWAGMLTMGVGEIANFAAYTYAPAVLVTPLGAMSVIIGAILAAVIMKESLTTIGKLGCALCIVGSIIIVLHAPADKEVNTVDEILAYAVKPGFVFYCLFALLFSIYMIYVVSPKMGKRNPMVYISICSVIGSISVMAIKAFGIAVKLTFQGNNQFTHGSTYFFGITVAGCIVLQMNYFNKALDLFDISIVNPLYYVCFTTATIVASFILFQGMGDGSDPVDNISILCGFFIIFAGIYILNDSRKNNYDDDYAELDLNNDFDNDFDNDLEHRNIRLHRLGHRKRHSRSLDNEDDMFNIVDDLENNQTINNMGSPSSVRRVV
jgi:uncharacterized membrane protein